MSWIPVESSDVNWLSVESSNVEAIRYDPELMLLGVRLKNGHIYEYLKVNQKTFDELRTARSIGSYLNRCIRDYYELKEWTPTPENVNALPEPIKRHVHDLATRCDPAGDVTALALIRDENAMLRKRIAELSEGR